MSNGDDVLDNWEEIDEAGLTNTLHKIQAERKSNVEQIEILKLTTSSSTASSTALAANQFQPMKLLQRTQSQDATNTGSNLTPNKALNVSSSSSAALKSPLDDMAASFQPVMMVLHQPIDEYQSANYTPAISSQTVKILRRPTQSSEPRNNGMRPRQPIKTLQQREQEYAEARLRILGSAKNPEDDVATSTAATNNTTNSSSMNTTPASTAVAKLISGVGGAASQKTPVTQNAYNNHQLQQSPANAYNNINYNNQRTAIAAAASLQQLHQQQQQQQQQQTWSPIVGGNVSSTAASASSLSLRQQQQESILRLPRGPDGSTGFLTRR